MIKIKPNEDYHAKIKIRFDILYIFVQNTPMRSILTLIIACIHLFAFAQVGIGTNDPKATLQITGKPAQTDVIDGMIPPKITREQLIAKSGLYGNNQIGAIIFVTDASGTVNPSTSQVTEAGFYYFNGSAWIPLKGTPVPAVVAECSNDGFVSPMIQGVALSNSSLKVLVTNNSFSTATIAFQNSDVVLSGVTGISVSATSPSSATLIAGQSQWITYTLSGTPTSSGTLACQWTKLSLNCLNNQTVHTFSGYIQDNTYSSNTTLNQLYVKDVALTSANTFTVTFTNNGSATIGPLPAPTNSNLALSGAGSAGISVTSVSPAGTYTLAAGASKTFTYTLSGTPSAIGNLTATWNYLDLTATQSKTVIQLKASGGIATIYQSGSNYYAVHKFNSSGNLVVNESASMSYLVVGGGGAGGTNHGGGGGGGGVVSGTYTPAVGTFPSVVGNGGSGVASGFSVRGNNGGSSSIFGFTAYGGGGGGGRINNGVTDTGANGATGGGGAGTNPVTAGTSIYAGQGFNGGNGTSDATAGNGGGGGGAGGVGSAASGTGAFNGTSGAGGIGLASSITGVSVYYGGGGSGGRWQAGAIGAGGLGGGANGGNSDSVAGGAGTANLGGGGGGGGGATAPGGAGGSGVVIVSYLLQ